MAKALKNQTTTVLSVIFACFSLTGWVYCTYPEQDFAYIIDNKVYGIFYVLVGFALLYKLIFVFIHFLFEYMKRVCSFPIKKNGISYYLFENNVFVKFLIISGLIYGFWWFVFFPGTLHPDMTHHLYQGLGIQQLNRVVPVLLTKLVGIIMTISKVYFLNDNVGVVAYIAGLYLLQCMTVSYVFLIFRKLGSPFAVRWFAFFYVYVIPVFSIWGVNFGKDAPYYNFIILFMCSLIDIIASKNNGIMPYIGFGVSFLGISFSRNNGIAMVIPALLVFAIAVRKHLKRFFVVCIACILIIISMDYYLDSHYEVGEVPIKENLSLPIQAFVSYLRECGDELSADEAAEIRMFFSDDIGVLVENYDPMISDPVKNHFIDNASHDQMIVFWNLWKKGFTKHPEVFIRGILRHIYGYFYPGQNCFRDQIAVYTLNFHTDYYTFSFSKSESALREALIKYSELVYDFPVTNMLYRPGFQMLVMLTLAVLILKSKNKKNICVMIPNIMMIFVVFSPVNAYFRYMLPVFASLPISLAWTIYSMDVKCN